MGLLRYLHNCGELEIQQCLGNLLRIGVLLSAAVVATGWGFHLARHGTAAPDYGDFKGEPAELCRVSGIVRGAVQLDPDALIQLGLLLLLATPVARVAFSALAFTCQKDWIYVLFTVVVLAILVYSFVFGNSLPSL
jgi:uncharacterized membrane protein